MTNDITEKYANDDVYKFLEIEWLSLRLLATQRFLEYTNFKPLNKLVFSFN